MNQIAAFLSPAALPSAAGAVVQAGQAGVPDEGFANVLAQLQALIGNPGATTTAASTEGALAQFQNPLGTTVVPSEANTSVDPSVHIGSTSPDAPAQVEALFDLLGSIGSPNAGEAQVGASAPSDSPNTALVAQLAALGIVLQNVRAQPSTSAAAAPIDAAPEQSTLGALSAPLGLRGTLVAAQETAQTAEPAPAAKNQQATVPHVVSSAAVAAAVPATQGKQNTSAQPENIAKAPAAPKRAANTPQNVANAQTESHAPTLNPKAPDVAVGNPSPTIAPQYAATQNTPADQSGTTNAQPVQPQAIPPAALLPNAISAQQFSVAVTVAPLAVPLEALAVHIARKFEGGSSQFEIRLHPAELGQLDISLSVADDGRVQAVLRAERPETLDILQRDARTLEQQLRQAGLDVGSNALSFSLSNGNGGRQAPFTGWPAFADANDVADTAKEESALALKYVAVRVRDGIDIRV